MQPANLYLVGGTIRDAFLNDSNTDLDLAIDLTPEETRDRCLANGLKVVETGIQHGTVLVVINNIHIEVTSFRQPADRNTQINARDIVTDLSGRDFTINAIAFSLKSLSILDPFKGIDDLNSCILRTVGDPAMRFREDPLRILRMVRFGDGQGRLIDQATVSAASLNATLLERVSVERIRQETESILMTAHPAACIRRLLSIGALHFTLPELIPAVGFEQNKYHIHDVFEHTLAVLERTSHDRILRWSAIFHDIGKPHTLSVDARGERHFYSHEVVSNTLSWQRMEKLRFSHDDMRKISTIVRHHMRPMNCGPAGARRLIRDLGDTYELWRSFKNADASPTIPANEFEQVANSFDALVASERKKMELPGYARLAVGGDDLIAIGIKPGPKMGKLLKMLEDIIIDDPTKNTKETLIQIIKNSS